MALPSLSSAHAVSRRGVTLLELLIVLTLMGVASALVAPMFARRAPEPVDARAAVVAAARRAAIRRAEPLRLQLSAGRWALSVQRDGAMVDSGPVADSLVTGDLLLDALGGCVPAPSMHARDFDPLACVFADEASHP